MEPGIDPELAKLAIIAVTVIIGALLACFTVVAAIAFKGIKGGAGKSFRIMLEGGNTLRIATVLFVVMAVILLSALNALNQGAIAVLSGVAGYVLGGLGHATREDPSESNASSGDKGPKDGAVNSTAT